MAFDLDLHCFPMYLGGDAWHKWGNIDVKTEINNTNNKYYLNLNFQTKMYILYHPPWRDTDDSYVIV